jgi:hypothetical protein
MPEALQPYLCPCSIPLHNNRTASRFSNRGPRRWAGRRASSRGIRPGRCRRSCILGATWKGCNKRQQPTGQEDMRKGVRGNTLRQGRGRQRDADANVLWYLIFAFEGMGKGADALPRSSPIWVNTSSGKLRRHSLFPRAASHAAHTNRALSMPGMLLGFSWCAGVYRNGAFLPDIAGAAPKVSCTWHGTAGCCPSRPPSFELRCVWTVEWLTGGHRHRQGFQPTHVRQQRVHPTNNANRFPKARHQAFSVRLA